MTKECIYNNRNEIACKLSKLASKYTDLLSIGSSCADSTGTSMVILNYLFKVTCFIKEDDECITDTEVELLFNHLHKELYKQGLSNC